MDNNKTLLEWLQRPIIAVVRHSGELDAALLSPCSIIELRAGSLIDLPQIVQRCRQARKALFRVCLEFCVREVFQGQPS